MHPASAPRASHSSQLADSPSAPARGFLPSPWRSRPRRGTTPGRGSRWPRRRVRGRVRYRARRPSPQGWVHPRKPRRARHRARAGRPGPVLPRGARVRRRRRGRRAPGPVPARWRSECGGSGRRYRVNERGTARGFGRRGSAGGLEMSRGVESTRTSAGMADGGSVAGAAAGAPAAGAAGLPGPVSAAGTAAGAPPGSATGSFGASLIVPCRGNYEAGLSAPDSDVSLGAGSRACAAGSGAYPSPSTSSRALWRCVLVCAWCWRAFVRAAASRAWTVCRGVGSRKRKRPTGLNMT